MQRNPKLAVSMLLIWGCGQDFAHNVEVPSATNQLGATLSTAVRVSPLVFQQATDALSESCDAPLYQVLSSSGVPYPIGLVVTALQSARGDLAYLTAERTLRIWTTDGHDWEVAQQAAPAMAFDPSGHLLAFSGGDHPPDVDLYLADIANRSVRSVITWPGPDTRPVFSPDGSRLAWVASVSNRPTWFVFTLPGGAPQPLFPSQFDWHPPSPTAVPALRHVLPVPIGPEPASWTGDRLRFFTGETFCTVEIPTGASTCDGGAP